MEPSQALRELRQLSGVRQEEIGKVFGLDQSLLSRYESGERALSPTMARAIVLFYVLALEKNLAAGLDLLKIVNGEEVRDV